eukprot:m.191838 g.191838  ORF g.191838 m.191838 type:complete len:88 (-) comp18601_c0_seq7:35-298(-)
MQLQAQIMNGFVKDNDVKVVIEFGFGDGQQLTRAEYPRYIGVDVSKTILKKTSERFASDPTKEFRLYDGIAAIHGHLVGDDCLRIST